jgi:hypothetical protein
MNKVIIRGETNDSVVFMGYSVKCISTNEYKFAKFTMNFPHSNAADFILMAASANIWINKYQPMLRTNEAFARGFEGTTVVADGEIDALNLLSKDELAAKITQLEAILASKK